MGMPPRNAGPIHLPNAVKKMIFNRLPPTSRVMYSMMNKNTYRLLRGGPATQTLNHMKIERPEITDVVRFAEIISKLFAWFHRVGYAYNSPAPAEFRRRYKFIVDHFRAHSGIRNAKFEYYGGNWNWHNNLSHVAENVHSNSNSNSNNNTNTTNAVINIHIVVGPQHTLKLSLLPTRERIVIREYVYEGPGAAVAKDFTRRRLQGLIPVNFWYGAEVSVTLIAPAGVVGARRFIYDLLLFAGAFRSAFFAEPRGFVFLKTQVPAPLLALCRREGLVDE